MKKNILLALSAIFLFASCGTYMGAGAATGAYWGQSVGGAIGGIHSGHRGYHAGSLIGMASGAMIGAAIGSAADQKQEQERQKYYQDRQQRLQDKRQNNYGDSYNPNYGYDPNGGGDDRLYDFDLNAPSTYPAASPQLEVTNLRFIDTNRDNVISRNERCQVVFEIYNRSQQTAYNILPVVAEVSGNKHVFVSQNTPIERIEPGRGVKYTANVVGDARLGNGTARIQISLTVAGQKIGKTNEFSLITRR